MKVILRNFKCHPDFEVTFSSGLNLLKGPSGIGKTTILQAIYWCLFRHLKNIDNPSLSGKLIVEIHTPDGIIIKRQKKPSLLTITDSSGTYNGDIAQSMINDMFGTEKNWFISTHTAQGTRNQFFSMSNQERLDFLMKIAFPGQESSLPSTMIDKVDEQLTLINARVTILDDDYRKKISSFEASMSNVKFDSTITQEVQSQPDPITWIKELENKILNMKYEHSLKVSQLMKQNNTIGERNAYQQQFDSIQSRLLSLIPTPQSTIDLLTSQITKIRQDAQIWRQSQTLKDKIAQHEALLNKIQTSLQSLTPPITDSIKPPTLSPPVITPNPIQSPIQPINNATQKEYTEQELAIMNSQWQSLNEQLRKAQELNIPYSQEAIQEDINRITNLLQIQPILLRQQHLNSLLATYNPSIIDHEQQANTNLNQLRISLDRANRARDVLTCPHCSNPIRFTSTGQLIKSDENQTNVDEIQRLTQQISQLVQELQSIEKQKVIRTQIESLCKDLPPTPIQEQLLSLQDTNALDNRLLRLRSITILPIPTLDATTIAFIYKSIVTRREHDTNTERIKKEYEINVEKIRREHEARVDAVRKEYESKSASLTREYDTNTRIIAQYNHELSQLPQLTSQPDESPIKQWEQQIQQALQTSRSINELTTQLSQIKTHIINLETRINPGLQSEADSLLTLIQLEESRISIIKVTVNALNQQRQLEIQNQDIAKVKTRQASLLRLREMMIEKEYQTLQIIVDQINLTVNEVIANLFDDPINIKIKLFKHIKSGNRTKPNVNFEINYRYGQTESINSLSGGEGDRVSLAMTLAFNNMTGSKFLMFDESLSSLNADLREMCLSQIREICPESIVICINHEDVEGYYDYIHEVNPETH